ncbi:MAG: hypothetical protein KC425_11120 [Anaerolineales bacterium]|nr:hypothetical protein [Anaerolineales bacterium]
MNRRTIAILIFIVGILILSAVGVVYVLQQGSGGGDDTPTDVADVPPGDADTPPDDTVLPPGVEPGEPLPEMVEVVVSIQTLPRGWPLSEAELTTDLRLASEVDENVITDIADAVGRYARTDIFQGETLTYDALITDPTILGQNEFGPSSLIPPGFVAAAVPLNRLSGVGYGLQPGDSIDILISFYFYQIDEQFQSYLPNSAQFFIEEALQAVEETETGTAAVVPAQIIVLDPYGRFEELPTGDLAHVFPSEDLQRPVLVSMLLQNAKVIQVGQWTPADAVEGPTPTPTPAEGDVTPPPATLQPTVTPVPRVLLVALSPQQHLFLKYAVESNADIDYALRGVQDGQLYSVQNVDVNLILERFGIDIPPNFNFSVDTDETARATPTPAESVAPPPASDGSDS